MAGSRRIVVVGDTGLLGEALCEAAAGDADTEHLARINSRRLLAELRAGRRQTISDIVGDNSLPQDWIYAAGVVDPKASADALTEVNCEAALLLLAALAEASAAQEPGAAGLRIVTIGSALEDRPELQAANRYLASKAALARAIETARAGTGAARSVGWQHLRLHTLYGRRPPHRCMFLGQMFDALRERRPFPMSSGRQLREYHAVDDVAEAILSHLQSGARNETATFSSGHAIRLGDLARAVFDHFGVPELLQIGAIADQPGEIYAPIAADTVHVEAREPISGILAWLEGIGLRRAAA